MNQSGWDRWRGVLPTLPGGVRIAFTAFLAVIGFGYLVAVANIYQRHALADGKAGLSVDDIRAVYGGLAADRGPSAEVPSRMLTMIRTAMRDYLSDDADFKSLEGWLKGGAKAEEFDAGEGRTAPRRVIVRNCLRCHAKSTGSNISKKAAFGEDEFDADPARLAAFTAPKPTTKAAGGATVPPQYNLSRLILVSHIHMLSIPMFTLVVGLLFWFTRLPAAIRRILMPVPMLALVADFGGWWLAQVAPLGAYFILAGGAVFGLAFGFQVVAVAFELWRPASPAIGERGGEEV